MAKALSITTLVGALEAVSEIAGPVSYTSDNATQAWLLERYEQYKEAIAKIPELEVWAKLTAEELNEILTLRGFTIQLEPWEPSPLKFGTLGILDFTVSWNSPGYETKILDDTVEAFSLNSDSIGLAYSSEGHPDPIISLGTKSGDLIRLTKHSEPKDEFALVEDIENIRTSKLTLLQSYDKVVVPKVHYSQLVDLDWVVGLSSGEGNQAVKIQQAVQEIRFGMNQHGARVKEATATGALASGFKKEILSYIFDEPFYIWIEREDIEVPLFQAWVGPGDWKDPGDLEDL